VSKPARVGDLRTYRGETPLGRETYKDDGDTLVSEIFFGPQTATITISRSKKHVRVESAAGTIESDIGPNTLALENGNWQAYALAAEQFATAAQPVPVKVLLPAERVTLEGTIAVTPVASGGGGGGGKRVEVVLKGLAVSVELDAHGSVVHAVVPAQGLEVRPAGEPPPQLQFRPTPSTVTRDLVEVQSGSVVVRGELWVPKGAPGKVPVVLLIAGSGPTDRDGNSLLGLRTDAYRMVAEGLATRGIATLRYDKRGVGKSGINFDPSKTVLGDFVADAALFAAKLAADPRFSTVTLAGHSEGGPIAILVAEHAPPHSLVLIASPGRSIEAVLREQLSTKLDAAGMADLDRILKAVQAGTSPEPLPPALAPLFNPTVLAMIRSELDLDAAAHLGKLKVKTAIIQGEHDAQVSVADAHALAKARPDARLTLLPTMNHVFKDEASSALPQDSYTDPSKPLSAGLIDAIVLGVKTR
jgi:pimeloyl-ACP methyl ester carboxylesterase